MSNRRKIDLRKLAVRMARNLANDTQMRTPPADAQAWLDAQQVDALPDATPK